MFTIVCLDMVVHCLDIITHYHNLDVKTGTNDSDCNHKKYQTSKSAFMKDGVVR